MSIYDDFDNARIEALFWLPSIISCGSPPTSFHDACEEILDGDHQCGDDLPEIASIISLRGDEELSDREAVEELAAAFAQNDRVGFLFCAAVPVTSDHSHGGYRFSWGHYRTAWLYAETIEAVRSKLIAWAEASIKRDADKAAPAA